MCFLPGWWRSAKERSSWYEDTLDVVAGWFLMVLGCKACYLARIIKCEVNQVHKMLDGGLMFSWDLLNRSIFTNVGTVKLDEPNHALTIISAVDEMGIVLHVFGEKKTRLLIHELRRFGVETDTLFKCHKLERGLPSLCWSKPSLNVEDMRLVWALMLL